MAIKVLTHFAHGVYQTELSKVSGVDYYHVVDNDAIKFRADAKPPRFWGDDPCPKNIHKIFITDVDPNDFDLILVHWHPFIDQFKTIWPTLPLIFLEHTWPYLNLNSEIYRWKKIRADYCDHTVFITPSSKIAWNENNNPKTSYIYHSIDIDSFSKKESFNSSQIMTTTNEFISRDWACGFSLWSQVLGIPGKAYFNDISLYGYGNSNIGKVAKGPKSREDILALLRTAGVYFNPSIMSPIPMSLLEATAVGTPIVSTAYCEPGTIFKNKEHGIISNDPVELRKGIQFILANPDIAKFMSAKAQNVVKDLFAPSVFQKEWLKLFQTIIN